MVTFNIVKTVVGFFLTAVLSGICHGQEGQGFPILGKYRNWGVVAGPVLYKPATINSQYGDYSFTNKPIPGYNIGIEVRLHQTKKWSFVTGLLLAKEPVNYIDFTILKEDIYSHYTESLSDRYLNYSITTFSVPLMVQFGVQMRSNTFLYIMSGLKVMYFPVGGSDFTYIIHNEELSESREIFGLRLESPQNSLQGSLVLGGGMSHAFKKILVRANVIYVMNFQNTIEGEYQFANLLSSPDTRGDYKLSGDYFGLLFSFSLPKKRGVE